MSPIISLRSFIFYKIYSKDGKDDEDGVVDDDDGGDISVNPNDLLASVLFIRLCCSGHESNRTEADDCGILCKFS